MRFPIIPNDFATAMKLISVACFGLVALSYCFCHVVSRAFQEHQDTTVRSEKQRVSTHKYLRGSSRTTVYHKYPKVHSLGGKVGAHPVHRRGHRRNRLSHTIWSDDRNAGTQGSGLHTRKSYSYREERATRSRKRGVHAVAQARRRP